MFCVMFCLHVWVVTGPPSFLHTLTHVPVTASCGWSPSARLAEVLITPSLATKYQPGCVITWILVNPHHCMLHNIHSTSGSSLYWGQKCSEIQDTCYQLFS